MLAIRRLLCVSFVLSSLAVPLHAAVTGTVINIDGKAVTGAKVALFAPELMAALGARLQSADPQRVPLATTTTDSGGKFTLDVPKDQIVVDVRVDAPGYAPSSGRYAADDDAGAILLTQAAPVRGTITANGKPVANATVAIFGPAEYVTKTDAGGHYTAPDLSKWAFRFIVLHPEYTVVDELIGPNGTKKGPDFSMNAGVAITGSVVAEDGQTPAADAQLWLDGWQVAKSAADGTFTIAHAKKEWDHVEARLGNRVAQRARTATGAATLKLAKGGSVSGSVRDVKSQLPVAGARVAIAPSGAFGGREATHDVYTDAKGNFTMSPVVAGRYDVRPDRPGYVITGAQPITVKGADAVQKALYATARGRISGNVLDEDKRPVAAAHLATARATSRNDMFAMIGVTRGGNASEGYSAPDGHFVLRNVETDADLHVDALKRGYPGAKSATLKLAAGERKTGVTITIPRGIAVTGRVTDKDHKPLSGVAVEAIESSADAMGGVRRIVMSSIAGNRNDELVRTGSDGTFSIKVKEGTYDLAFNREGFANKTVRGTKVDATTKPVEVALDPGVEITGRVTRGGAGVEGVNIRAMSQGGFQGAVTGPDGAFRIADLTPGQMMLIANKQDSFIQEMRPVTAPSKDIVIELPAGGRITGRVLDKASHEPVTSFMAGVTTSRSGGGMVMMMPPMQKQFTSDDGSFVLEGIKPGSTQVVVNAPGYTTARVANIEVEDGKTAPDVEVDVETGAKLTGRVTGPDGSPVAGVSVREDQQGGGGGRVMRFDATDTSGTTDPNGDYTIDTLEPGEKTFTFSRGGFIAQQKTVSVAAAKETRLDVQLSSGLRATGFVVTDGGAPIPDTMVRAASASEMDGGRSATTDSNGAFAIEALAPGHYTFTATKNGFAPATLRDVDIASSGPVRVILKSGGVISGHVNGLTPQELEQTTVTASVSGGGGGGPFGGGGGVQAPVDSAGNFRMDGAPSGTIRISARTGAMFGGASKTAAPKTVELEPGGTAQVDIDFKSSTVISGRIMRNSAPVAGASITFIPRGAKSQTVSSATADSNGHYEVNSLDDGTYLVQVVDMARLSPFSTQYEVHGSDTFDITIKTVTVRGRVVDTNSHPLDGATVDLRQANGQSIFGGGVGSTDPDGRFTIENVAAGTYQITADKSGYGHDSRQIIIGDSDPDQVQFQLSPGDGITIRAIDTRDNTPLTVNVLRVVDSQGNELPSSSSGFFGNSSETVNLALAPGVYTVTVIARNYASQTLSMSSPSQQVVRFSPGGTIILHSKDSSTRRARLIDAAGVTHGLNPISQGISPLPPGTTQINNVAAGHYTLQILDNSDRITKTVGIDVIDGQQSNYDV
ncbi:MAG TPA: carboxypeptidase regulatory-like domain-containing protein [Thermoanaerobaculia bacterium]|nr:carboxypeptidase regulatory-like domain-containing protein [Thermoanaerobaculia bacterium]